MQSVQLLGYRLEDLGFKSWQEQKIFCFPKRSDQLWGPYSFLFSGYWWLFYWRLTAHLCLVPRLRTCGAIHPLSHNMLLWDTLFNKNFKYVYDLSQFLILRAQIQQFRIKPKLNRDFTCLPYACFTFFKSNTVNLSSTLFKCLLLYLVSRPYTKHHTVFRSLCIHSY